MKIAIIFSICIHSVFYFAMAGFFFPDFKKNNKNLELHSTSISIMDLPSYDAMISNEPILKSSNYEILNWSVSFRALGDEYFRNWGE